MTNKSAPQQPPEKNAHANTTLPNSKKNPNTVNKADAPGHRFFRLSLSREDVTDWSHFEEIRDLLLSMGTLEDMEPQISRQSDLEAHQGEEIIFLFSTVLDKELLVSLFSLEPEQVQLVSGSEKISSTATSRVPAQVATLNKFPAVSETKSTSYAFPALFAHIGPYRCALPPAGLQEAVRLAPGATIGTDLDTVANNPGRETFQHRGETLPLIHLPDLLGVSGFRATAALILIIHAAGNRFGLLVDEIMARKEIVAHPMPPLFNPPSPITAAALSNTGEVALLLDYPSLLEKAGLPLGEEELFTRTAPDPNRPTTRTRLTLVTFTLGNQQLGIDIRLIREINHASAIPPLPGAAKCVHGLLNIRGQTIILCNLKQRLGWIDTSVGSWNKKTKRLDTCNIIIKSRDQVLRFDRALAGRAQPANEPIGLTIDQLGKRRTIAYDAVQSASGDLANIPEHFIQGVVSETNNQLIILDMASVLESMHG